MSPTMRQDDDLPDDLRQRLHEFKSYLRSQDYGALVAIIIPCTDRPGVELVGFSLNSETIELPDPFVMMVNMLSDENYGRAAFSFIPQIEMLAEHYKRKKEEDESGDDVLKGFKDFLDSLGK